MVRSPVAGSNVVVGLQGPHTTSEEDCWVEILKSRIKHTC